MPESTQDPSLQFYLQEAQVCPYLPEQRSGSVFALPQGLRDADFETLLARGFRRSGTLVYRPWCEGCRACVSLRVDVRNFEPSGDQRRALNKNRDVCLEVGEPCYTEEKHALYQRFLDARYPGKEACTQEDYERFLVDQLGQTHEFRYLLDGQLIALGLVDLVPTAASSVYFFFDPQCSRRSLGTYSALQEIDYCQRTGRSWLYLGYRIQACAAMKYKSHFRPHQLLSPKRGWIAEADWTTSDD